MEAIILPEGSSFFEPSKSNWKNSEDIIYNLMIDLKNDYDYNNDNSAGQYIETCYFSKEFDKHVVETCVEAFLKRDAFLDGLEEPVPFTVSYCEHPGYWEITC